MKNKFTFIDLFAGIGGFRLAFESLGGKCVFSSEIDPYARETYKSNFGEYPSGDITKTDLQEIPEHDILCAGFPCQPFSLAGLRKGFNDSRGTLFFEIEKIIQNKKPKAIFLENVKGLLNHDKGKTLKVILSKLNGLGYNVFYKVLNSKDYGVPQNRERILIIGFNKNIKEFNFPEPIEGGPLLSDLLDKNLQDHKVSEIAKKNINLHLSKLKEKKKDFSLNDITLIATEIRPSRCVFRYDGVSPCLTAKMGTGGNNVPVVVNDMRKLTTRECLRLQGFPEDFHIDENSYQSYKQIGNSVTYPVIKLVGKEIVKTII